MREHDARKGAVVKARGAGRAGRLRGRRRRREARRANPGPNTGTLPIPRAVVREEARLTRGAHGDVARAADPAGLLLALRARDKTNPTRGRRGAVLAALGGAPLIHLAVLVRAARRGALGLARRRGAGEAVALHVREVAREALARVRAGGGGGGSIGVGGAARRRRQRPRAVAPRLAAAVRGADGGAGRGRGVARGRVVQAVHDGVGRVDGENLGRLVAAAHVARQVAHIKEPAVVEERLDARRRGGRGCEQQRGRDDRDSQSRGG